MKRIKIAYITKNMPINGISTVIKNYCLNINANEFEIIVIAGKPVAEYYSNLFNVSNIELRVLNGDIHNPVSYYGHLYKALRSERFDIVHVHGNSATISIELLLAALCGKHIRIAHSHNSTCTHKIQHYLLYPFFSKLYTMGFACSSMAGKWMFRDNPFEIIPNGFDTRKFIYNPIARKDIREELHLDDGFIIANVARFNDQKNHCFLLKIFERIAERRSDAYLLLVGDGPLLPRIKSLVSEHRFRERIIYYGTTDHVEKIYSAADAFLLPSKFEGLGIVFIEAQISGLPVVTSNVVPKEIDIHGLSKFVSLDSPIDEWADAVLQSTCGDREKFFYDCANEIEQYDIKKDAKCLENIYRKLYFSRRENGK